MKIIISRTDSIGDVILTLPLCGWIKQNIPGASVIFLCQKLTEEIVSRDSFVDEVIVWEGYLPKADAIIHVYTNKEVAWEARRKRIPIRIGTSHRSIHWITCNRRINFSRIKSDLHESQLNFKLLKGLGQEVTPKLEEMCNYIAWNNKATPSSFILPNKFNLIFHMKSRGSAKEWASSNYLKLAGELGERFNIILTGTEKERALIMDETPDIFKLHNVTDSTGQLSLAALIDLIGSADGLLACSTGPLHIAAISGIHTLGLYPSSKPMHAGRWGPLGHHSEVLSEINDSKDRCLQIPVEKVREKLEQWVN